MTSPLTTMATLSQAALLLGGCDVAGERAVTGDCPSGEICSELTPDGLYFRGAPTSPTEVAVGVLATAVGGYQTLTVREPGDEGREPFSREFGATAAAPFAVGEVAPPSVEIVAEGEGKGLLRLVDPASGELFDRAKVEALPLEHVEVIPIEKLMAAAGDVDSDEWVLYAGGAPELVVRLRSGGNGDGDGRRLVDEGIVLAAGGAEAIERVAWDRFSVQAPPEGDVEVMVTSSAGREFLFQARAVGSIDAIARVFDLGDEVAVGRGSGICFVGRADGAVVSGLDWSFAVEGPLEIQSELDDFVDYLYGPGCVSVEGTEPGSGVVIASAGGMDFELELTAVADDRAFWRVAAIPVLETEAPTPGERARAARR